MSIRVGITGGTGFVAGALAAALSKQSGGEVRLFGRTEGASTHGARVLALNFSQAPFEGLDCVVHSAGITTSRASEDDLEAANVVLSLDVARSAAASGVRRLVFISSLHVHGKSSDEAISPDTPLRPWNSYGRSKAEAELRLREEAAQLGLELVILRAPMVYGEGSKGSFPLLLKLVRIGVPLPFLGATARRSVCSIDNLVSAIQVAIAHPNPPDVLIPADGDDQSTRSLCTAMAAALGRSPRLFPFSRRLLTVGLAVLGRREMAVSLFEPLFVERTHWRTWGWSPVESSAKGVRKAVCRDGPRSGLVIFVTNTTPYFFSHRLPLARATGRCGFRVAVAGIDVAEHRDRYAAEGFSVLPIRGGRRGIDPLGDIRGGLDLARHVRTLGPQAVHATALKAIFITALAGLRARLPRTVCVVTGLGSIYINDTPKTRLIRRGLEAVLGRMMSRHETVVVFQNKSDRTYFLTRRILPESNARLIPGSGVDVSEFAYSDEPVTTEPLVMFPARLLVSKGIREFVAAAQILRERNIPARFALVGDLDPHNPDGLPADELADLRRTGVVEVWGFQQDMRSVLASANIVCLPSYREGLPKSLIEAAASGRAILTTDVPGCRDVVADGVNGLLVPPRDAAALAVAMERLVLSPDLRRSFGRAGRRRAETEFAQDRIIDATLALYGPAPDRKAPSRG